MKHTITFDLSNQDAYADIYLWAHANGGYRYVELSNGEWGRLPSTCIVVDVPSDNQIDVAAWFSQKVESELDCQVTNVSAIAGEPSGLARPITVPHWAKDTIVAQITHRIKLING